AQADQIQIYLARRRELPVDGKRILEISGRSARVARAYRRDPQQAQRVGSLRAISRSSTRGQSRLRARRRRVQPPGFKRELSFHIVDRSGDRATALPAKRRSAVGPF